jgi:hypothetical protein
MKTHELFPALKGKPAKTVPGKPRQVVEVEFGKATPEEMEELLKMPGVRDSLRFQELLVQAAASGKLKKWNPEQAARKYIKGANKPPADERHYSPAELADAWGLSADMIRVLFEREPGVLIIGDEKGTRRKRRYRTIKIPQSVAVRVKNRLSSRPAPLKKSTR